MKKYLLIILALLCAVAQGAWADADSSNRQLKNICLVLWLKKTDVKY